MRDAVIADFLVSAALVCYFAGGVLVIVRALLVFYLVCFLGSKVKKAIKAVEEEEKEKKEKKKAVEEEEKEKKEKK